MSKVLCTIVIRIALINVIRIALINVIRIVRCFSQRYPAHKTKHNTNYFSKVSNKQQPYIIPVKLLALLFWH